MTLLAQLVPGVHLYDRRSGQERLVDKVETFNQVVFLSFKHPRTGEIDRQPFPLIELESRFELLTAAAVAFRAKPEIVSLVAEAHRLRHAYLFNRLFATETSLIDLLPHQLAAVYGVPGGDTNTPEQPGMLDLPRLRFLLADDAGAGKTIMIGLVIREMLLRRLVRRVLVVPPAGLARNWERELRILFRLGFRLLSSADMRESYNPFADPQNDLAIMSVDTLWRDKARAAYLAAPPYDLVIFDEAHKLAGRINADFTIERTRRYEMAELIARQQRHLILATATPHMGKDEPYYLLWRLLEPELFAAREAFERLSGTQKRRYLLRRMKEEMVNFEGRPLFPPRDSKTIFYPLRPGPGQEQDLYNQVTRYCETYYDLAKRRNRSAAGLAMSILQRRLASSTGAILESLRRREQKLQQTIRDLETGLLSEAGLAQRQQELPTQDVRDAKTGDEEEAETGQEEAELQDESVAGATAATNLAELRQEWAEVKRQVNLAVEVFDQKYESKFERLWAALEEYPDTKVLIFTEFRDTLNFLVDRLEEKGLTGKIAQIHGGMAYPERERQVSFFRDPAGARLMVATDAAGEGINLQFCWLMVNYDIPWNPARLEQRMGRVHRYKQTEPVLLLNLVSKDTREGRVLSVLLEKLETIRKELDDKVFDIIGQQFTGKPLTELIFEAVVEGKESQAVNEIGRTLNKERVQAQLETQKRKVELSQVRALLEGLQKQREVAEMRRVMPAYIRRFFRQAAHLVGAGLQGDLDGLFRLDPCPPGVRQALQQYPEAIQSCLTFNRELAMPDLSREPRALYIHPGEPVFEAVADLFLGQYDHQGMRGAIFFDSQTGVPYIFYLAKVVILRDAPPTEQTPGFSEKPGVLPQPELIEEKVTGVRRYQDGRCELAPAHWLLTLITTNNTNEHELENEQLKFIRDNSWNSWLNLAGDRLPVEAFLVQELGQPALETWRQEEKERLPQQLDQLRVAYNLRQAELFRQKRALKEAVEREVPAAQSRLRQCEAELKELDQRRREAEAVLLTRLDRLRLGPVSLYAQALVLPLPVEEAERQREVQAEQVALDEVIQREQALGATIENVSAPHLKAGFDLKVLRSDGEIRYVEVKGRSGRPAVELTENEWAQAANHRDRYWLYVVYDCETVPQLYRVADPFGRLLAKQTGAVRIKAGEIIAAAEV